MINNYNGVKFLDRYDLASGYYLNRASEILDTFNIEKQYDDVNVILEFYNICKYLEDDQKLSSWNDDVYNKYKDTSFSLKKKIGIFMSKISSENLLTIYNRTDVNYQADFWELFDKHCLKKEYNSEVINQIIRTSVFTFRCILLYKRTVNKFSEEIREFMMNNVIGAEILIDKYLAKNGNNYFLPSSLTVDNKKEILREYVKLDNANINYVRLIVNAQSTKEMPIDDLLKYEAKKSCEKLESEMFKNVTMLETTFSVAIRDLEQISEINFSKHKIEGFYDEKWLKNNLDYPTICNNFIYVFEFFDMEYNCNYIFHPYMVGVLESIIGIQGKKYYSDCIHFRTIDTFTTYALMVYYNFLLKNSIDIQKLFKWFFEEYLLDEFGVKGFSFYASSQNTTTLEKIKNLISEMESVLKQYSLYAKNGTINRELFLISSQQIIYKDIPSLINNKFCYPLSDSIKQEIYFLFSSQSPLVYLEKIHRNYENFYKLLVSERININDYLDYQQERIKYLISKDDLMIDEHGFLKINYNKILVLYNLYKYETFRSDYHIKLKGIGEKLEELEKSGDVTFENTLFSRSEVDYINFVLNKAEFSNGLDLRNRYSHGLYSENERQQFLDYMKLTKVMLIVIMRINEEFCLKNTKKMLT